MAVAGVAGVACGLLTACAPPLEPVTHRDRYLVHAVLNLSRASQIVIVEHTELQSNTGHGARFAAVTITGSDGSVFTGVEDTTYFQQPLYMPYGVYRVGGGAAADFRPGTVYTLRIRVPGGDSIVGETRIPDASPSHGGTALSFDRARDTIRLAWPRVPGARAYQVSVSRSEPLSSTERLLYSVFTDTAVTIAGTVRSSFDDQPVFIGGFVALLTVVAVDDNYYTYYHNWIDPFAGAPPSRLIGGLGVFGSIVPLIERHYTVH